MDRTANMNNFESCMKAKNCVNRNVERSERFCVSCRNHGRKVRINGHKNFCPYRDCQCEHCLLVQSARELTLKERKLQRKTKLNQDNVVEMKSVKYMDSRNCMNLENEKSSEVESKLGETFSEEELTEAFEGNNFISDFDKIMENGSEWLNNISSMESKHF
ncbi:CLUMA_CG021145, isoform A [Clunio marinus]|uniref:CLUMA_CG021145, isoform A n=1 Tax=Clunio marinus TaxID=568069 RepID=A0A1J1J6H9_9DIPT|nr:CLUMA_CG021145, isoform A [Clunio marinus]